MQRQNRALFQWPSSSMPKDNNKLVSDEMQTTVFDTQYAYPLNIWDLSYRIYIHKSAFAHASATT